MAEGTRMLQRRGTEAQWDLSTYVPGAGELCVATDSGLIKVGDGVNVWTELPNPFDLMYLPLEGTAANSDLLGGISAAGFLQADDAETIATPDTIAKRDGTGKLRAAAGTASDDLINFAQITQGLLDNRKTFFGRILGDATTDITLEAIDVNTTILVTNNSSTVIRNVIIPTNATVAIPIGAWVEVCNQGTGLLKLVTAGGVTLRGTQNIFTQSSTVRLRKTATNEWLALSIGNPRQGRLPKMRIYRNAGTNYLAATYQLIAYTTVDAAKTFNPSDEYFSIDPVGLNSSRRIIVNKDGEYKCFGSFVNNYSSNGFLHIVKCTGNNVIGETLSSNSGMLVRQCEWTGRLSAGESVGMAQYSQSVSDDSADSSAVGSNRNDFHIIKIGD